MAEYLPEFIKSLDECESADEHVFYEPTATGVGYRLLPYIREQVAEQRKQLAELDAAHAARMAELEKEDGDLLAKIDRAKKEIADYHIGTSIASELTRAGVTHPGLPKGATALLMEQPFTVERLDNGERQVIHRDGWSASQVVARWLAAEGAEFLPKVPTTPTPVAVYVSANRTVH